MSVFNEGPMLCQALSALRDSMDVAYEIMVVNDASTNGCCDFLRVSQPPYDNVVLVDLERRHGVARARNAGAKRAHGRVLVFMDAHCFPRRGWLEKLLAELRLHDGGIVAPQISSLECPSATTFGLTICNPELGVAWLARKGDQPYPIPVAAGGCMAMYREFFEALGHFEAMRSYGAEDVEMCLRAWLCGYSVTMVPDAQVAHWFKNEPFAVGWQDYLYNRLRTAVLHFDGERRARIVSSLRTKPEFSEAASALLVSDVWARYRFLRARRKYDADWFCRKFGISI